jgi:hypothetical protein
MDLTVWPHPPCPASPLEFSSSQNLRKVFYLRREIHPIFIAGSLSLAAFYGISS